MSEASRAPRVTARAEAVLKHTSILRNPYFRALVR